MVPLISSKLEESQPVPGVKLVPHSHQARTRPLSQHGSYTEPYHLVSLFHISICKHEVEQGQCFREGAKGPSKPVNHVRDLVPSRKPFAPCVCHVPSTGASPSMDHRPREKRNPNKATKRPAEVAQRELMTMVLHILRRCVTQRCPGGQRWPHFVFFLQPYLRCF